MILGGDDAYVSDLYQGYKDAQGHKNGFGELFYPDGHVAYKVEVDRAKARLDRGSARTTGHYGLFYLSLIHI